MSNSYVLRMDELRRNREELTARRVAIEKRIALREATAAEFSAINIQNAKQKWKKLRSAAVAAQLRNDDFIRSVHETQKRVNETYLRQKNDLSSSTAQMTREKARYFRKIEDVYPAWQEKLQEKRIMKLRSLEEKKRAVDRRRYLAKKSHEIELSQNLEKNEACERDMLRNQSVTQAMQLDQSIREHALGARTYLRQQAATELTENYELSEDINKQIFDTFSPRSALNALRQANSSLQFEEPPIREEALPHGLTIQIPKPMASRAAASKSVNEFNRVKEGSIASNVYGSLYSSQTDLHYSAETQSLVPVEPSPSPENKHTGPIKSHADLSSFSNGQFTKVYNGGGENQRVPTVDANILESPKPMHLDKHSTLHNPAFANTTDALPFTDVRQDQFLSRSTAVTQATINMQAQPNVSSIFDSTLPTSAILTSVVSQVSQVYSPPGSAMPAVCAPVRQINTISDFSETRSSSTQPSAKPAEADTPIYVIPSINEVVKQNDDRAVENTDISQQDASKEEQVSNSNSVCYQSTESSHVIDQDLVSSTRSIPSDVVGTGDIPGSKKNDFFDRSNGMNGTLPLENMPNDIAGESKSDQSVILASSHDLNHYMETKMSTPLITNLTSESHQETIPDPSISEANSMHADNEENSLRIPLDQTRADDMSEHKDDLPSVHSFINASVNSINTDDHDADPVVEKIDDSHKAIADFDTMTGASFEPTNVILRSSVQSHVSDLVRPLSMTSSTENLEDIGMLSSVKSIESIDLEASRTTRSDEFLDSFKQVDALPPTKNDQHLSTNYNQSFTSVNEAPREEEKVSPTERLSMPDRLKALSALISRVEEGASEGDQFGGILDAPSSNETKRELVKMAVGGRKAQIAFFGSDICFELILDLSRDLGPVIFPARAFEGIMNDQKIRKLHQSSKDKELDLWKLLSNHMKQLLTLKALSASELVDMFGSAFLHHDSDNQRSQRKLREFLFTVCEVPSGNQRRESLSSSPPKRPQTMTSSSAATGQEAKEERMEIPSLLQTAFLQHQSPPKPKTFSIASSGLKKNVSSDDFLNTMASPSTKLSQKLLRGGKMSDYSEFEEEDEVDIHNLIGSGRSITVLENTKTKAAANSVMQSSINKPFSVRGVDTSTKDDTDFDVDF